MDCFMDLLTATPRVQFVSAGPLEWVRWVLNAADDLLCAVDVYQLSHGFKKCVKLVGTQN